MALNTFQKNIVSKLQNVSEGFLSLNDTANIIVIIGPTELAGVTNEDLAEVPDFAHMTLAEMNAARAAIDAISTVIETNMAALLKVLRNIPT